MSGLKFPISPETWALLRQHPEFYESINRSGKRVGLQVRLDDREATTELGRTPDGQRVVTVSVPVDDDARADNGRYLLKDRFFFDDSDNKFLRWNRELVNPGADDVELQHWLKFQSILSKDTLPKPDQAKTLGLALWPTLPRPTLANPAYWKKLSESPEALRFVTQIGTQAQSVNSYLQLQGYSLDSFINSRKSDTENTFVQRWVLDQDRNRNNGRIIVEDRFVTDLLSGELTGFDRKFHAAPSAVHGEPVPAHSNIAADLAALTKLPTPTLSQANSYFKIMGPYWQEPIALGKLYSTVGKINDLDGFFSDFNEQDRSYFHHMVFAARTANPYLTLKSQVKDNTYAVQYLGDRREITMTWLLADYRDPEKNQVLCRDSFLVSTKTGKILSHERFFSARKETWNDPSVISALSEVSGTSHLPPVGAAGLIKKVTPRLLPVSLAQTEAAIVNVHGARPLQIPLNYHAPVFLDQLSKSHPVKNLALIQEGMDVMEVWVKARLDREVSAGKSWSPWSQPVDVTATTLAIQEFWSAWESGIQNPMADGPGSALRLLEGKKLSAEAQEWRQRILADPSALALMDALAETDLRLRDEQLLVLAREEFMKGPSALPEVALALSEQISKREPKRGEARDLLAFFGGGGSVGLQSDLLGSQFIDHVLDESMVVAMMGAGLVGSALEYQSLLALGRVGRLGRWGATGIGIGGEAASFTTLANAVRSFHTDPELAFAHWGQETLGAGVLFSLFRIGHGFTAWGAARLTSGPLTPYFARQPLTLLQGVSPALRPAGGLRLQLNRSAEFLLSGTNFLWGVEAMYLSGEISRYFGWAPETHAGWGQLQFKALTDYLGAMIGYRFANGLSGGRLNQGISDLRQRSLRYREQVKSERNRSEELPPEPAPTDLFEVPAENKEKDLPEENLPDTEILFERPPEPQAIPVEKISSFSPIPIAYHLNAARNNILAGEYGPQGIPSVKQNFPGLGRWWGITEEGVGYGGSKKGEAVNQDALAWSQSPDGSTYFFNLDGMGGHAHGKEAALLAAHHLVGGLREGRPLADVLFGASEAIQKNYLGSGAVFGGVRLSPSGRGEAPVAAEFFWGGDIRLLVARKDGAGQYQWIYRNIEESPATELADLRIRKGEIAPTDRSLVISLDPFKNLVSNHLGRENFSFQSTKNGFFPDSRKIYQSAEGHEVLNLKEGDLVATFSDGIMDSVINTQELLDYFNRHSRPEAGLLEAHAETRYKMQVFAEAKKSFSSEGKKVFSFEYQGHVPEWQGQKMYVTPEGHFFDALENGQLFTLTKPDNISLSVFEIHSGLGVHAKFDRTTQKSVRPRSFKTPVFGSGVLGSEAPMGPRELPPLPELPKFPEGKIPPNLRIGQVDVKFTQKQMMAWLRAQALAADGVQQNINLSSAPQQSKTTIEIQLNLGELLEDQQLKKYTYVFPLEVYPGQNRMAISQLHRDAIHEQRLSQSDPKARAVLEVLENLNRATVHPQVPQFQKANPHSGPQLMITPESNAGVHRHNKHIFRQYQIEGFHPETKLSSERLRFSAKNFTYHGGEIHIDVVGKIIACDLGPMDADPSVNPGFRLGSPQPGSLKVPVIVFGDTVVWTVRMDGMNPKQISELLALTEGAAEIHQADPYAIDVIRGKHDGPLVKDLVNILNDFHNMGLKDLGNFQIHLVEQGGLLRAYSTLFAGPMTQNLKNELGALPAIGHVLVHFQGAAGEPRTLKALEYMPGTKGPDGVRIKKILRYIMGQ